MVRIVKGCLKQLLAFLCNQYLVIFFIIALGIKLAYISTYVIKLTWSGQYIYGIMMGYACAAILFSPLFLIKKYKNKLATILAFIISVLLLIDVVYFSYFGSLPTVGLLGSVGQTESIVPAIVGLIHWYLIFYFADIILVIVFRKKIVKSFNNLKEKYGLLKTHFKTTSIITIGVIFLFWLSLSTVGLNTLRDVINRGYDTVSTAQYYGVLGAHAIDLVRFVYQETADLSDEQKTALIKWVRDNKPKRTANEFTGVAKGKNIIMIQVESLGGFVINQTIDGKEITPNLNKLAGETSFFPNNRFVIGAGHTSDADLVANTSYFPLDDAATFVRYGQDDFTSLPKNLITNKYSAYAYHGFNRNFWNRNVAISSLGYQKFYAADNFSKAFKVNMGLNDGTFLSETADYIAKQPKPSFSYVITLSSHVPFNTKEGTRDLGVNVKDYPDQVGGYLETINYTDRMLGTFFDKLKADNLYDDSLIVIYGDHVPVLGSFKAGSITYDPDSVQGKETPLFVKMPKQTIGKTYEKTGNSLDIMPTILDLAGIKTTDLMFGRSLFATGDDALTACKNQIMTFKSDGNCEDMLITENKKSAEIIRYNQFGNLPK